MMIKLKNESVPHHLTAPVGVPSGAGSVWSFGSTKQSPDGEVLCVGAHLLFPLYVAEAYEGSILGDLSSLYSASVWCLNHSFHNVIMFIG